VLKYVEQCWFVATWLQEQLHCIWHFWFGFEAQRSRQVLEATVATKFEDLLVQELGSFVFELVRIPRVILRCVFEQRLAQDEVAEVNDLVGWSGVMISSRMINLLIENCAPLTKQIITI
jgi:hypothetical protein